MCRLGEMRDPVSQLLFQKGMSVRTTSLSMSQGLHGRFCSKNHQHQALEGNTTVKGHSMKRTEFSERYPRKFARYAAKLLIQRNVHPPKGYHDAVPILVAEAKRKRISSDTSVASSSKRLRTIPAEPIAKRLPARLIRQTP